MKFTGPKNQRVQDGKKLLQFDAGGILEISEAEIVELWTARMKRHGFKVEPADKIVEASVTVVPVESTGLTAEKLGVKKPAKPKRAKK